MRSKLIDYFFVTTTLCFSVLIASATSQKIKAEPITTRTIVAQSNRDDRSYFSRGIQRIQSGNYQGAVADFTQVLQQNPRSAEAYLNRGLALVRLKNIQKHSKTSIAL